MRIRTPAKDGGDIGPQGWFGRVPSACSGFHILSNIGSIMGSNIGSNMGSNIVPTSSTAPGGGGSFRIGNLQERLVVVHHG